MKMFACIAGLISLFSSVPVFAQDVILQQGQSVVVCVEDDISGEPNPSTAMMKMNQLLSQKTIVVPGTPHFSIVYIIQAPFAASAPSLLRLDQQGHQRLCVTLTQL